MAVVEGAVAPDFSLSAGDGEQVSLADLRGKTVVLYFYPKDDTPGCTKEACSFRDSRAELEAAGAVVIGLSPDGAESHRKFSDKYALTFPLLADVGHAVADEYGVWVEKSNYGKTYMGIERSTFVIDSNGVVRRVFRKVRVDGHVDAVLAAVRSL